MKTIWRYIKQALSWIPCSSTRFKTIRIEDLPDKLDPKKIYLVGEGNYLWYAAMMCPCGCDEILYMSLMPDQRPRWRVSKHFFGSISLHPSVWRKVGCRSHFWVKKGKVLWHRESGDTGTDRIY